MKNLITTAILCVFVISGCASPLNLLSKRSSGGPAVAEAKNAARLAASTESGGVNFSIKVDKSVFLDPVSPDRQIVFVRIRNTTGRDGIEDRVSSAVFNKLSEIGYQRTNNPDEAQYILQGKIVLADYVNQATLEQVEQSSFGESLSNVVGAGIAGGAIGGFSNDSSGSDIGSVVGILGGLISESQRRKKIRELEAIKVVSVVTDLELRERAKGVVKVTGKKVVSSGSGSSNREGIASGRFSNVANEESAVVQEFEESSQWKKHRIRIVSKASGKDLLYEDVQERLEEAIAKSLVGLF